MEIRFRFFLIIFSLTLIACKQDTATQNQTKLAPAPPLPDSILLHQADSLFRLGEKSLNKKKTDSALYFHNLSLTLREEILKDDSALVRSYFKIGSIYLNDIKYDVADRYFEKARLIAESIAINPSLLIELNLASANCRANMRDIAFSASLLHKTEKLAHVYFPENHFLLYRINFLIATDYFYDHQFDKSIEYWQRCIAWASRKDYERLAKVTFSLGMAFKEKNEYPLALSYFNKTIKYHLQWTGPNSEPIAKVFLQKAFTLMDTGQMDSAKYFLVRNLEIRRKIYGEKSVNTFGAKYSLGNFFDNIGDYDSASQYYHASLISLVKDFNEPNIMHNPMPNETELNTDLLIGLKGKAEALYRLTKREAPQVRLMQLALETFLLTDSVFSVYRNNFLFEDSQFRQLEVAYVPYYEMVDIALQLFTINKDPKYFEIALTTMERSRAILLQNSLSKAEVYSLAGVDKSFKTKENAIIKQRVELVKNLSSTTLKQAATDSLNDALVALSDQFIKLQNEIEKSNPNYGALKYLQPPLKLEDVHQFLREKNSILLEYMWSDSAIYALAISPDSVRLRSIPITGKFNKVFNGFTNEFHTDPEGVFEKHRYKNFCLNSSALYNFLLKDFLDGIKPGTHLIISADGPLATIPFDALITSAPEGDEVNYHLPYLVLEHPLSYAYSAGVLLKQSARQREGKKLLAFGYAGDGPALATRSGLTNLPGTEKEILAIKDVMKNHVNLYELESEASESHFKQQVSDFDIVHLAIHGEGDTLNALNSRLIFRSDHDTVEDGSLYAHELYDLKLDKLDLAVLSACESGVGKQQAGEGVMSIARGFAYAGCPSLVISLWKINDHTSAQVMKGFYHYLADGDPLDVSLAKAKTDYIKGASEFNSHPFYWAAFLQAGDTRSIAISTFNLNVLIPAVFLLLIGLVFFLVRRLKKLKPVE